MKTPLTAAFATVGAPRDAGAAETPTCVIEQFGDSRIFDRPRPLGALKGIASRALIRGLMLVALVAPIGIAGAQSTVGASPPKKAAKAPAGRSLVWEPFLFPGAYGQDRPISESEAVPFSLAELSGEEFFARVWATGLHEGHFELQGGAAAGSLDIAYDRNRVHAKPLASWSSLSRATRVYLAAMTVYRMQLAGKARSGELDKISPQDARSLVRRFQGVSLTLLGCADGASQFAGLVRSSGIAYQSSDTVASLLEFCWLKALK